MSLSKPAATPCELSADARAMLIDNGLDWVLDLPQGLFMNVANKSDTLYVSAS